MPPKTDPEIRLADAALRLLAKRPWQELTLAAVARAAKLKLAELQRIAPSKPRLFGLILKRLGAEVAAQHKAESGETHDRMFDVAMAWFDALAKHKKAVASLYDGLRRDPLSLVAARGDILEAAHWLMALAEADSGPALSLRALGFAAVLGHAVPAWLEDGPDLAKTMARLDTDLRRGESVLKRAPLGEEDQD